MVSGLDAPGEREKLGIDSYTRLHCARESWWVMVLLLHCARGLVGGVA